MRFPLAHLSVLLTASLAFAQAPTLPDGLKHVPPDALGFIHFRAGDFLKSAIGKQLLSDLRQSRDANLGLQKIEEELGLPLADIDTVTVLMLSMPNVQQMRGSDGPGRLNFRDRDMEIRRMMEMERHEMRRMRELEMMQKRIFEEKIKEDKKPEDKKPEPKESPVLFQDERRVHDHIDHGMNFVQPDFDPTEIAGYGPLVIVTATKDVDRKKILKTQLFKPHSGRGPDSERAMQFLGERTMLTGPRWERARHSEHMARPPGPKTKPMQAALALAGKPHVLIAGGQVPEWYRSVYLGPIPADMRALATIAPLFQTEMALAIDLGKSLDLTMLLNAQTEASA